MSVEDKIKKARESTVLPPLQGTPLMIKQPAGKSETPQLSEKTVAGLHALEREAQKEAEEAAKIPDEDKIPDNLTLDPLFSDLFNPPSLSLANVARRKIIEARLDGIRIDDLFVSGEIRQRVPIIPGKLELTYRTLSGDEDLYAKRRMGDVRTEINRYVEDRFVLMVLALHIHSYNGEVLPSIFDEQGHIIEANFDKKFQKVAKLPQMLLEDIWINYRWFEDRVRRALEPAALKVG